MTHTPSNVESPVVALFNSSDDTVDMVQRMLAAAGITCLAGPRLSELRRHPDQFARYLTVHNPDVVIFDITIPYQDNWHLFTALRIAPTMERRGVVVTTPNKEQLDIVIGHDSDTLEIIGKPYDLDQIKHAIEDAVARIRIAQRDRR